MRSSASDSAPSASDSEARSVGEELEAKVKREKALAGGEDVTDIIGDEGDSSMGDVAGESVDDASSSSRSRSAAGSDSVCVCSHCSRRAVVGEHEDDGRRVGLGVGGRRFGDDRVGERRRDEADRGGWHRWSMSAASSLSSCNTGLVFLRSCSSSSSSNQRRPRAVQVPR